VKKTKHIQLVLITAAFSSCSRVIIANEPLDHCPLATTLTQYPVDTSDYVTNDEMACCETKYGSIWTYSYTPLGPVYAVPVRNPYFSPGKPPYRKQTSWSGTAVVVRGGFGISAKTSTLSS
jgi:hypothetical protein